MKSSIKSTGFQPMTLEIIIENERDLAVLYHRFHSEPLSYVPFVPKVRTTTGQQVIAAKLSDLVRERGLWRQK